MIEKDIEDLTKEELLDEGFIPSIYENYKDEEERNNIIKSVLVIAKNKHVLTKVKEMIKKSDKGLKLESPDGEALLYMDLGNSKKDNLTVENFKQAILKSSEIASQIRYNVFTNQFERVFKDGMKRNWIDNDDAWVRRMIQNMYGIYDKGLYNDAFIDCVDDFKYHPIQEKIESIKWDGKPRIDNFLEHVMNCEPGDYSREVSRMLFYGGINRIYHPGCKFDYMIILVGEQGTCKSTLVDWLNIDTGAYREVTTIDGKDGAEIVRYGWMCEFGELLAMVKSRMVEPMKAFVTRTFDNYRVPYTKYPIDIPRHCVFIGTTNSYRFLIDSTGNRRYLPIDVHNEVGYLYKHEKEIKEYIEQCWAEAKYLMDEGKTYLVIDSKYQSIVNEEIANYIEEDPQLGLVSKYLEEKEIGYKVSTLELHIEVLGGLAKKCTRLDSITIGNYMRNFPNWKQSKTSIRFEKYGKQRYWEKIK